MMKKLFFLLILIFTVLLLPINSTFADSSISGKTIILDPGHGGSDSGAVNGVLREADVNLDIANRLKALLEKDGATAYLTRDCDCTKSNEARYTFANNAGGQALVSIHLNGSINSNTNGTQGLYGQKNKDLGFTKVMHQALFPSLGVNDLGITNFASGVLLKSNMPATIAETVFITNSIEYQKLTDGTGNRQQVIAQNLKNGLVNWFSQPSPTPKGKPNR